jgi:hypothetical protein
MSARADRRADRAPEIMMKMTGGYARQLAAPTFRVNAWAGGM